MSSNVSTPPVCNSKIGSHCTSLSQSRRRPRNCTPLYLNNFCLIILIKKPPIALLLASFCLSLLWSWLTANAIGYCYPFVFFPLLLDCLFFHHRTISLIPRIHTIIPILARRIFFYLCLCVFSPSLCIKFPLLYHSKIGLCVVTPRSFPSK